jgi:hypothetical protein
MVQERGFRDRLQGLSPRERNKTLTANAGPSRSSVLYTWTYSGCSSRSWRRSGTLWDRCLAAWNCGWPTGHPAAPRSPQGAEASLASADLAEIMRPPPALGAGLLAHLVRCTSLDGHGRLRRQPCGGGKKRPGARRWQGWLHSVATKAAAGAGLGGPRGFSRAAGTSSRAVPDQASRSKRLQPAALPAPPCLTNYC